MFKAVLKDMRTRDWVFLTTLSIVVSFCCVLGASYVLGGGWPYFYPVEAFFFVIATTLIFGIVFILVDVAFAKLSVAKRPTSRIAMLIPKWSVSSIAIFSAIMLLAWMPWFVANYPGGTYWDTYYQIFQVYPENHPIAVIPWAEIYEQTLTDAWLVDHHPVFTTLIYGAFGWVSDQLTGNWMLGVAVFCVLQGALHTIAFTASIAYLDRIGCPKALCLFAYLFLAIMPFISTWAMCMVKDSFFGLFIIPYFMMIFEAVRTRGKLFARPRNTVWFLLCGLGLCLTKKTGIFVVIITALVAFIVCAKWIANVKPYSGKHAQTSLSDVEQQSVSASEVIKDVRSCRQAFVVQALSCAAIMLVLLPMVVFPALNIRSGGLQETLGPLFQQTARAVVDHEDTMTEEEKQAIAAVLDYDKLETQYRFDFEDSVKYRYNLNATTEDLANYFKVYFDQGIRYPDSYFGAIMSLAGFYIAPCAFVNIRMVTVDTKMGPDDRYMLWNPDELDAYRHWLDDTYKLIAEIPVLDIPLLIVTYAFWLPAAMGYVSFRRRLGSSIMITPFWILLAFCVIAPVYDARYVVPVLDLAPLFVCSMACLSLKRTKIMKI